MLGRLIAHRPGWSIDVVVDLALGDLAEGLVRVIDDMREGAEVGVVAAV
jgi:hypothetical protein